MEMTKLNVISDFVSPLPQVPQLYTNFLKWGTLILAVVATFTSIITRIKRFIIRVNSIKRSSSSKYLLDDNLNNCTDEDDDSSFAESITDEEIFESTTPSFDDDQTQNQFDEDFNVAGSSYYCDNQWEYNNSKLRRRASGCDVSWWPEFVAGKNVVKMWDSRFDFQSFKSEISICDLGKDEKLSSFLGGKRQVTAVTMSSPAVLYIAEMSDNDRVALRAYDRRMGGRTPAVSAEWGPGMGDIGSVGSGGVEKVYVKGDGVYIVGDIRDVRTPLENVTEADVDTWWDADAIINQDEF